jgi:apolipoprotein N-acyltransferase
MNNWWRLVLAAASGLLLTVAFPPFHFYYGAWISIVALMIAVAGFSPRRFRGFTTHSGFMAE